MIKEKCWFLMQSRLMKSRTNPTLQFFALNIDLLKVRKDMSQAALPYSLLLYMNYSIT